MASQWFILILLWFYRIDKALIRSPIREPFAGNSSHDPTNFGLFSVCELNIDGTNIFLQIFDALGARNGNYVGPLPQHPGNGQLGGGAAFGLGKSLELVDDVNVGVKVFVAEPWEDGPPVALAGD